MCECKGKMNRDDVIGELKRYFDVRELVCPHTYRKFGDESWKVFDGDFLKTILILRRDVLNKPMIVNTWHEGGRYSQRGYRCNICQIPRGKTLKGVSYISAHCLAKAIDFDVKGMEVFEVHKVIEQNIDMFFTKIRMEKGVSWNHLDIYHEPDNPKFYEFNP